MRTSLLCWMPPHVFKKIFVITCRFQPSFCCFFFFFFKSTDLPDFVQRPVQRPKTASSVPLRSWWRRSSRLRGCGRTTTRVRGSSWRISSSRAAAGPAAATAPSPETPTKPTEVTPGKRVGRTGTGPELRGEEPVRMFRCSVQTLLYLHTSFTTRLSLATELLGRKERVEVSRRILKGRR